MRTSSRPYRSQSRRLSPEGESVPCAECGVALEEVRTGDGVLVRRYCDEVDCRVAWVEPDPELPADRRVEQLVIAREELERQRDRNWNVGSGHALVRMDAIERGEPDPGATHVTSSQEEILRYLVRRGQVTGVHFPPAQQEECARMCEAGLLRQRGISRSLRQDGHGTLLYDVTADGFDAVAE